MRLGYATTLSRGALQRGAFSGSPSLRWDDFVRRAATVGRERVNASALDHRGHHSDRYKKNLIKAEHTVFKGLPPTVAAEVAWRRLGNGLKLTGRDVDVLLAVSSDRVVRRLIEEAANCMIPCTSKVVQAAVDLWEQEQQALQAADRDLGASMLAPLLSLKEARFVGEARGLWDDAMRRLLASIDGENAVVLLRRLIRTGDRDSINVFVRCVVVPGSIGSNDLWNMLLEHVCDACAYLDEILLFLREIEAYGPDVSSLEYGPVVQAMTQRCGEGESKLFMWEYVEKSRSVVSPQQCLKIVESIADSGNTPVAMRFLRVLLAKLSTQSKREKFDFALPKGVVLGLAAEGRIPELRELVSMTDCSASVMEMEEFLSFVANCRRYYEIVGERAKIPKVCRKEFYQLHRAHRALQRRDLAAARRYLKATAETIEDELLPPSVVAYYHELLCDSGIPKLEKDAAVTRQESLLRS